MKRCSVPAHKNILRFFPLGKVSTLPADGVLRSILNQRLAEALSKTFPPRRWLMAVAQVANHGERHVNPLVEQRLERQSGTNTPAKENSGNKAVTEDTFTSSAQNNPAQTTAQDAGIFQLNQAAVAASTVLAQPTPGVSQIAVSPQTAAVTTAAATASTANAQTSATSAANAPAIAAQQVGATPVAQAATTAVGTTTNVQNQIQSLNTALAALGLSNYDIEQIDRIATVIQNFSPTAYTDLVDQFQQLARQVSQPAGANVPAPASAPANTSVVAGTNATANANTGTNANTPAGNFQVQGITINFTGVQEAANSSTVISSGQGASTTNTESQTVNLQIEQVQFTLTNGNGQAVKVLAPQQSAATAGGNS
jgi:hypothetical protein